MLDSNTFDYIYDYKLTDNVRRAVDEGKIKPFATDVQKQEIEKIAKNTRKRGIKQMAEKIQVTFLETSACVVDLDKPGRKGFNGSRVGMAKVVSDNDAQLLEVLTKANIKVPLKNKTDLLICYTAIKENMDFLVTANTKDFENVLELFRLDRGTKLQRHQGPHLS
jgi:rRNA-processing protein FCF1